MTKLIAIVLATVMLLSVAGCDRKPTQTTEATEEETTPTTHETTAPIQTDETTPETQGVAEQETTVPNQETTSPTDTTAPTEPEVTEPKPTKPPVEPTEPKPTEKPAETHKHSYQSRTVEATCEQKGCTVYTCVCGDSYTADEVKALGHDYTTQVVAPTNEAGGYTTYSCKRCGHSYQDDFTDKLPQYCPEEEHRYAMVDWLMPTEENPVGWTKYVCLNCGHTYTEETAYVPPASASGVETELLILNTN